MSVEELIQLMRTCSLAQVRAQLEEWVGSVAYDEIVEFYEQAKEQKPK